MNLGTGADKAKRYRYISFAIISTTYLLVYFHRLCPAVIAVDMQEYFNASGTLLGLLSSAYFYPYAIMQLPGGLLVDSWGPRKTVSVFLVLAAFGSALMGLTTILSVAFFGRLLVGIGVSTVFVANFKLLSEWFDSQDFTIMGGAFMGVGGVGVLFSTVPLAWLSDFFGWRMTLLVVGVITLLMATLVHALVFDRPADRGWASIAFTRKEQSTERISLFERLGAVVTEKHFWPIALWSFCAVGIFFALAGLWGGPYLIQVYGLSKTSAGTILAMSAVALIIGSPLLGLLANRVGRKPILIGASLTLLSVLAAFYTFPKELPRIMLYVLFFCVCLATSACAPVIVALTKELFPPSIAGTSVAFVNLFPFLGGPFFQIVLGVILSQGGQKGNVYSLVGYQNMFFFCLLGSAISLVVTMFMKETVSRE